MEDIDTMGLDFCAKLQSQLRSFLLHRNQISHMSKPQYHVAAWLEKYGWEEGKGLGKNLDGDADFIHVSKKDDTLGV